MRKLFVVPSDAGNDRIVWCPPSAMEPCEALKPPASTKDEDFKGAAASWIESYKVCKLKQQIIKDCIEQFNSATSSKSQK
jgi:hypothetical protein